MAKRCPPGAICIENCTLLFMIIALCLLYMLFTKNSRSQSGGLCSERIHVYSNQPVETPMMDRFPAAMFENRDVFSDPYAPPLRDTRVFPKNSSDPRGIPINVKTQGHDSPYRQVGMLSRKDGSETMLPLMGRPLLTNRDKCLVETSKHCATSDCFKGDFAMHLRLNTSPGWGLLRCSGRDARSPASINAQPLSPLDSMPMCILCLMGCTLYNPD